MNPIEPIQYVGDCDKAPDGTITKIYAHGKFVEPNEPTTEYIATAMRDIAADRTYNSGVLSDFCILAADRLESQQRWIEYQESTIKKTLEILEKTSIPKLQAEIERMTSDLAAERARADAAEQDFETIELDGLCEVCFFADMNDLSKAECMEDCCFRWSRKRGQTEKGETNG